MLAPMVRPRWHGWLLIILTIGLHSYSAGQGTSISGIVNDYASVQSISGNNKLIVHSTAPFLNDDRILIIQMQGATIDESNTASFGAISDTGQAGRFEMNTVCMVNGDTIVLDQELSVSFNPSGNVQVVGVPQYNDANVTTTLTAPPWNDSTGGVIALQVNGTLTLNASVDAQGLGFKGGDYSPSPASCNWWSTYENYYYAFANGNGLTKGQGIAAYIANKEGGRGPQGTGGGGGNNHNSGGGGGAHAGSGGQGGNNAEPGTFNCDGYFPGFGGYPISPESGRLFFGGGGGSGHGNNNDPGTISSGGAGGGIVIIQADTLIGNSYSIDASGNNGGYASNDGAGGGGAGGTVILDVAHFDASSLFVHVTGGNGGNADNDGVNRCFGPGGGGGGGVVQSTGTLPGNVSLDTAGGVAGETINSTSCSGNLSATDGTSGTLVDGVTIPNGGLPGSGCPSLLPIEGLELWINEDNSGTQLRWKLRHPGNIVQFIVEFQSTTGIITKLGSVQAKNDWDATYTFPLTDFGPGRHYVRLQSLGADRAGNYSHWITWVNEEEIPRCEINPTLISTDKDVYIQMAEFSQDAIIETFDASGRGIHFIHSRDMAVQSLRFSHPGVYIIWIRSKAQVCQSRIFVQP